MSDYIMRHEYEDDEDVLTVVGELVRCKDCKHWLKGDGSCFPHADYNDFCSNGERKDDEID